MTTKAKRLRFHFCFQFPVSVFSFHFISISCFSICPCYLATKLMTGAEASLLTARIEVSFSNFKLSFRLTVNFIVGCLAYSYILWYEGLGTYFILLSYSDIVEQFTASQMSPEYTWMHLNNWGIITGAISICIFHLSALDWSHVTLRSWIFDFQASPEESRRQPYWQAIVAYSIIIS